VETKRKFSLQLVAVLAFWISNASAYEVWMGTHLMRSADANDLSSWSMTASQLDGFNVNRAPHDTDPASNAEYRKIFAQFTNADQAITEFARSQATRNPANTDELAFPSIAQRLEEIFSLESNFGYELTAIMFYDERGTYQGNEYLYEWTEIEIQYLRDWLDTNGHSDIELKWNVRNNSVRNRQLAANPLVDSVEIEASTTALLNNTNNQITFFSWYWNNPATVNKPIALQIPRTLDGLNQIKGTREVAQMIGGIIGYGDDGMRSDRLIFLPVTYNDNYDYLPETVSAGSAYTNSLSSIALSLLEQRSLFEGRVRAPAVVDAHDLTRLFAPTVNTVPDQAIAFETSTGPLPFIVGDDATPVSSLTVTASSSNTELVPITNIILGGAGANRTVTVTPAPGQNGSTEIELWVGDGTLAAPIRFTVDVLGSGLAPGVLYSHGGDCAIKENLAIEKLSDATLDVGARGASPWVERCSVFVFELPDFGSVTNPFHDAEFTFEYLGKNSSIRGYDLYGLGRRSSSTVLGSDFYSQSATPDPTDATRLQQSILTDGTPLGLVTTTEGGSANLVNHLNAQYAGGTGAGEFVFLRINTRSAKSGVSYATLTMSEGGVAGAVDTRPRISYQASNPAPTITSIADQELGLNSSTGSLLFTIGDDSTPAGSLMLEGISSNTTLVPPANITFGGSGANRTIKVTPLANTLGMAEITVRVSDGTFSSETRFAVTVEGALEVIAGWDHWDSNTSPNASVMATGISASATSSTASGNWSISDDGSSGRGSSGDQTWGSFNEGTPASGLTSGLGANMMAANGVTDAEVTFMITNNGPTDWELNAFHMDVIAFRPNAPRAYQLEVLSGDLTTGIVFTSADDEINHLGGNLSDAHDDHGEIDLNLKDLADSTLESGEEVVLRIAFTSGTGSGGGHHLFLDNVAVSGSTVPPTGIEAWRFEHFGTTDNAGIAADNFDVNGDGESNLLEFATNQSPLAKTLLVTAVAMSDGELAFQYVRSKAALVDGVSFQVEWSNTLLADSWHTFGVDETIIGEDGEMETIVATVSAGFTGPRFMRLVISK